MQDHFRRDSTTTQGVKARGFGVRRRIRTSSRECRGLKHNGNGMQDAGRGMIAGHPDVADLSRRKVGRLAEAPRNPRECDEEAKALPAPDRRCLCRPRHETGSVGRDAPWRPEVLSRNGRPGMPKGNGTRMPTPGMPTVADTGYRGFAARPPSCGGGASHPIGRHLRRSGPCGHGHAVQRQHIHAIGFKWWTGNRRALRRPGLVRGAARTSTAVPVGPSIRSEWSSAGRSATSWPSRSRRPDRRDILPTRPPQPRHLRARATSSARATFAGC